MTLPSLETASFWANLALVAFSVLAATAGCLALYFSTKLGAIKDADLELFRQQSAVAIAKADARAAEANEKAEQLTHQNLETASRLEKERITRLELEKSLAPRDFPLTFKPDNFEGLKPFRGTRAVIEYIPDVEAWRAASQIQVLLQVAQWSVIELKVNHEVGAFLDGVVIAPHIPNIADASDTAAVIAETNRLRAASDSIVAFLKTYGWEARTHAGTTKVPEHTIQIAIGFKPSPYFKTR